LKVWTKSHSFLRPIFKRNCYQSLGWLYDVHWDCFGRGLFFVGSNQPTLNWEPIVDFARDEGRLTILSHPSRHGAIWNFKVFIVDGHRMVISGASDGTVLLSKVRSKKSRMIVETKVIFEVHSTAIEISGNDAVVTADISSRERNLVDISGLTGCLSKPAATIQCVDALCYRSSFSNITSIAYGGGIGLVRIQNL